MWKGLEKKWKVSKGKVLLILMTFAIGGSLTGYAGKRIMRFTGIENPAVYIPVYILLITLLWPFLVLCVSIFTGQLGFFRMYIRRLGNRMGLGGSRQSTYNSLPAGQTGEEHRMDKRSEHHFKSEMKRLIVFASGAGSNTQRIIDYFRGTDVQVVLIVCNKRGAGVISIAENEKIPVLLIEKERFFRGDAYLPVIEGYHPNLLVLAGFLWKVPDLLIQSFPHKIINIHPALLPKYGGKGMYGQFVHEAVVEAGDLESGITVHYVDEDYDNGDVIFQTACPVLDGDSPEKLAARIHELEHLHYPAVIEDLVNRES